MKGSLPEPPPQQKGLIVPKALVTFLEHKGARYEKLVHLIKQRDAFGQQKYGQPLMSDDGRNGIEDARQELGDLLQYVYKAILGVENELELLAFYREEVCPAFEIIKELLS